MSEASLGMGTSLRRVITMRYPSCTIASAVLRGVDTADMVGPEAIREHYYFDAWHNKLRSVKLGSTSVTRSMMRLLYVPVAWSSL